MQKPRQMLPISDYLKSDFIVAEEENAGVFKPAEKKKDYFVISMVAVAILSVIGCGLYFAFSLSPVDSVVTVSGTSLSSYAQEDISQYKDGKVNINAAEIDALCTLNSIGESKASEIISYRETHGKFKSIEDIKNVKGIGDSIYKKIKDYICV